MDWGDVSFLLMGFLVEQQVYLTPGTRCRVKHTLPAHGSDISFFCPFFLRNFSEPVFLFSCPASGALPVQKLGNQSSNLMEVFGIQRATVLLGDGDEELKF